MQPSSNRSMFPLWVSRVVKQLPAYEDKDSVNETVSAPTHPIALDDCLVSSLWSKICVWGCPDLHSIDVLDFGALKTLFLTAAEILLLFSRFDLFGVSFYINAEDILPLFSNSEHAASPHWLWGGCGSRSCWSIPACLLMGSPGAASLLKTKHHPSH